MRDFGAGAGRLALVGGLVSLGMLTVGSSRAFAQRACVTPVAISIEVQGHVEYREAERDAWVPVVVEQAFCGGEAIRVGPSSRAALRLSEDATGIRVEQNSTLTLPPPAARVPRWLELLRGAVHLISRTPAELKVKTPFLNGYLEGTEFLVDADTDAATLRVFEGRVRVENTFGSVSIGPGEQAVARREQPPRRSLTIDSPNAAAWTIYYPPILDMQSLEAVPVLGRAVARWRRGEVAEALASLAGLSNTAADTSVWRVRAVLYLSVGQVRAAEDALDRLPARGDRDPVALSIRSIVALANNDQELARRLAERAGAVGQGRYAAPLLARSYLEQAQFDLVRALQSARSATDIAPTESLGWARVAELELSLGRLHQAEAAARRSVALDPDSPRTRWVLGFADLARLAYRAAEGQFLAAIRLDSSDPIPRLGLGLARIRRGQLHAGTEALAAAATLDPSQSLVRSYLGKAYYEVGKSAWASREFELAKQLDRNDPTPWLYAALSEQAANRPGVALQNLRGAIARNDNRAVYRSRLLLDADRATRNTSLGRLYADLGMTQPAIVETARSLGFEPSSAAAHRLLGDLYAGSPRHQLARGSELLQARLTQPLSSNPVRPSRNAAELSIAPGTRFLDGGFNEFSPLFERDRTRLLASGFGGAFGAWGEEAVLSGLYDRVAFSVGQLRSETDGFRVNSDGAEDQRDAFVQAALSPSLDLQAHYSFQDRQGGDGRLQFGLPDPAQPNRQATRRESGQFGVHLRLSERSEFVASYLFGAVRDRRQVETTLDQFVRQFVLTFENTQRLDVAQFDARYAVHGESIDALIGGSLYETDTDPVSSLTTAFRFPNGSTQVNNPTRLFASLGRFSRRQQSAYSYSYLRWPEPVVWTVGLSYDRLTERDYTLWDGFRPKFGWQWNISENWLLRGVYAETSRPAAIFEQSLEPTQIAGFNQFFDDPIGTRSRRYGLGFDGRFGERIYFGIEGSRRELKAPFFQAGPENYADVTARETECRFYLKVLPTDRWILGVDYRFDRYAQERLVSPAIQRVKQRDNGTASLSAKYFDPSGVFASIGFNGVHQDIQLAADGVPQSSAFVTVDLGLGYRLPKRLGIVTLRIDNLLDEAFRYEDDSFRTQSYYVPGLEGRLPDLAATTIVIPRRSIFAGLTLAW